MPSLLPPLPEDFEPTRATLHAYAKAVGVIPRCHATAHDHWWHISLKPRPTGLVTEPMLTPDGVTFQLRMDLNAHEVALETSTGRTERFPMGAGATGTQMGDALIAAVSGLGLAGDYATDKFATDERREYDPTAASRFFRILSTVAGLFAQHRATLSGAGPVQVWPHGFDIAFEWFGSRIEEYEEGGETKRLPSQLNLGFYPGGRAYFYSNPWPFDDALTATPLPSDAEWRTGDWNGSILYYDQVAGRDDAADLVLAYARAVYEAASPTLTAP
jgi:hypothetical protein